MQPADLNMTTTVTGHQLFLFVTFGDGELAEAIDLLGQGMENMQEVVLLRTMKKKFYMVRKIIKTYPSLPKDH